MLHLTEKEKESVAFITNLTNQVKDQIKLEHEQTIFQDPESFLRTIRIEDDDIDFF